MACSYSLHTEFFTHTPVFPTKVRLAPWKSFRNDVDSRYNAPPPTPDPSLSMNSISPCTSMREASALHDVKCKKKLNSCTNQKTYFDNLFIAYHKGASSVCLKPVESTEAERNICCTHCSAHFSIVADEVTERRCNKKNMINCISCTSYCKLVEKKSFPYNYVFLVNFYFFYIDWSTETQVSFNIALCWLTACELNYQLSISKAWVFSTFWNTCMRSDVNPMAAPEISAVFPVKVQFSKWAKLLRWPSGPSSKCTKRKQTSKHRSGSIM